MMSTEGSGENATPVPSLPGAPEQTYLFPKQFPKAKGHSRSVSHGGTPIPVGGLGAPLRPSALKSAVRGHQRAFSHGQIGEGQRAGSSGANGGGSGHSRTSSRTDFILPPGHREQPPSAASITRQESQRGHSRQASRTDSIYTLRRTSVAPSWRRAMRWVLRREQPPEDNRHLVVVPNHLVPEKTPKKEHPNGHRCYNEVRTTKYTILSFIPKNLLEQFHRIANLYFIFIVLLNWVPAISAFGKQVALIPVLFVLGVTMIKDLFEDRRRYISDKRINNSYCRVYRKSVDRYVRTRWRDVRVGDIVHLSNNEAVPADMVLLRSSERTGVAYLDTCNLDGETNLKQRLVTADLREKQATFSPSKFVSLVEVDRPSTKITRFHGFIAHPDGSRVPLTTDNLLLRECHIKNTNYVEGIVVYAGHETKAMLNNNGPRYKRSKLERAMNTDIVWCVLVLLLMCCVGAVCCKLWLEKYAPLSILSVPVDKRPPFIPSAVDPTYSPAVEALLIFWTYVILLQVMIPLSLYVTIEMVKLLQVYHIHNDVGMYDPTTDRRVQCRALNVTEELGQVQYLFSDKTGTLTENKMIFRRCVIGGVDYEHPPGPPAVPHPDLPPIVVPLTDVSPNPRLMHHLAEDADTPHAQHVREFLVVLAVCNTVVVQQPHVDDCRAVSEDARLQQVNGKRTAEQYARLAESRSTTPSPPPQVSSVRLRMPRLPFGRERVGHAQPPSTSSDASEPPPLRFEAESPDELALAEAALAYGVELRSRTPDDVTLGMRGELTHLRVLRIQQFDATRKCMSIALKAANGTVVLYVKGADSTVMNALTPSREDSPEAVCLSRTRALVDEYSRAGLRTLAVARRTMSVRAWEEWVAAHARAGEPGEGRDKRLRDSLARLESGLTLLGATGVEDRLQEDVPRTVRSLLEAGIVVWVLTGDKPETAVNVAYSANLFSQGDRLAYLMSRNKDQAESTIQNYLDTWAGESGSQGRALVVDGKTLTYILDRRSGLVLPFLSLARRCSSVLCCRATPLQKAFIVKAVKEELGVTTLAIGDGANDVSMIQMADVGIGLSGQEGMQAVMASDFALSRFKYLERFLLVHGHWCYDRLARMMLYFFLKNATFVFLVFWFQLYNGFSASVMIDQLHIMAYNLMFTALPPMAMGAYDRAAPASLLLARPGLYRSSRLGKTYRPHAYWATLAESLYISLVIFFINLHTYWDSDVDLAIFGLANMTCCLVSMTLYVGIETRSWTIIHVVFMVGSLGAFFVLTLIYNAVSVPFFGLPSCYWVMQTAFTDCRYYLVILLTVVASLAPRLAWRGALNTLCPGALGLAVMTRRRRSRLPYTAHYHTDTSSAHVYRSTPDDAPHKSPTYVTAIT